MTVATTWHPSKGPRTNTPVESRPLPRTDRFRSHAVGSRVIAVFGVLSILAAAWWVTNSKIFELRTVDVVGNRHLSSAQVLRLAALTRGTNVFWFSSGSAERRLMASPWVERATISRTLPGDVTVTIRERFPVAIVSAASGRAPRGLRRRGAGPGPAVQRASPHHRDLSGPQRRRSDRSA